MTCDCTNIEKKTKTVEYITFKDRAKMTVTMNIATLKLL